MFYFFLTQGGDGVAVVAVVVDVDDAGVGNRLGGTTGEPVVWGSGFGRALLAMGDMAPVVDTGLDGSVGTGDDALFGWGTGRGGGKTLDVIFSSVGDGVEPPPPRLAGFGKSFGLVFGGGSVTDARMFSVGSKDTSTGILFWRTMPDGINFLCTSSVDGSSPNICLKASASSFSAYSTVASVSRSADS